MPPKLTFKEQMKGFPLWQIIVISIIRFSEPVAFTSLFPYVYFMIRDFGIADKKEDIATYSGYLSASFAFFQFMCCVQWGKASDKVGRKVILLIGLFGTSCSLLLFGFSKNFYIALLARSTMGMVNGNIAVLRTAIGEIATERRHQAIAFSTLPLLWNVGSVIGPMIGGSKYLTRPKGNPAYDDEPSNFLLRITTMAIDKTSFIDTGKDSFYESFITKHPYALSNIVVAIFLWFSMLVGFLFLEETHERYKRKRDRGLEIGDVILRLLGFNPPVRPWQKSRKQKSRLKKSKPTKTVEPTIQTSTPPPLESDDESNEVTPFNRPQQLYSAVEGNSSTDSIDSAGPLLTRRYSNALVRRYSSNQLGPVISNTTTNMSVLTTNAQGFNREIFTKPVVQTIIANFLTSFHSIVYSEFLPVMLAGDLMVDKLKFPFTIKGGFGYESSDIGTLLSTTGLIGGLGIMFVFPLIDRNFKTVNSYRASASIFPFSYFILPYLIFTLHAYNPARPEWLTKACLYALCCTSTFFGAVGFPNILILIHRASPAKHRAFINGLALSLSSLARCIGPVLWGYIMSLCEKYSIGEVSWLLLSMLSLICCIQAYFFMEDYDEDLKDPIAEEIEDQTELSTA